MEFFDKKEEVLEVKLTPYGRYKLMKGLWKPAYYAFFDEGVIYNSAFAGFTEGQNNIEPRIQDNTPSLKPLNVFTGIQTAASASAALIRSVYDENNNIADDPLFMDPGAIYNREELQYVTDRVAYLSRPLGKSRLNSNKIPAWELSARQGTVSSVTASYSSSAGMALIPQLDINIKYYTYASRILNYSVEMATTGSDNSDILFTEATDAHNEQAITTHILPDGTYIVINPEDLVMEVIENNADFGKENFDIEVFASSSSSTVLGGLTQLQFNNNLESSYTPQDVQYHLTVESDNEIDAELMKKIGISDFIALGGAEGSQVVSTRDYWIKNLYDPEEDICD
tara:strand:+ start:677 stop:1696 length:1020 start_codon:yes stop_codon:yes gene_type:complete